MGQKERGALFFCRSSFFSFSRAPARASKRGCEPKQKRKVSRALSNPPTFPHTPPPPTPTGKVIDIAIAFVVGAAFTDLIKTFVSSFVTPLLAAIGSKSFSQLFFTVRGQKIAYGPFFFS